uniref:Uncharacterized protein n=1 Tax=Penaeus monodon majanivirus A TaxID=2984271 RepID=A0A9C7C7D7_9VIRU|nr:MAG: hypothetical protein [Penaeus monodon majanivirus A]
MSDKQLLEVERVLLGASSTTDPQKGLNVITKGAIRQLLSDRERKLKEWSPVPKPTPSTSSSTSIESAILSATKSNRADTNVADYKTCKDNSIEDNMKYIDDEFSDSDIDIMTYKVTKDMIMEEGKRRCSYNNDDNNINNTTAATTSSNNDNDNIISDSNNFTGYQKRIDDEASGISNINITTYTGSLLKNLLETDKRYTIVSSRQTLRDTPNDPHAQQQTPTGDQEQSVEQQIIRDKNTTAQQQQQIHIIQDTDQKPIRIYHLQKNSSAIALPLKPVTESSISSSFSSAAATPPPPPPLPPPVPIETPAPALPLLLPPFPPPPITKPASAPVSAPALAPTSAPASALASVLLQPPPPPPPTPPPPPSQPMNDADSDVNVVDLTRSTSPLPPPPPPPLAHPNNSTQASSNTPQIPEFQPAAGSLFAVPYTFLIHSNYPIPLYLPYGSCYYHNSQYAPYNYSFRYLDNFYLPPPPPPPPPLPLPITPPFYSYRNPYSYPYFHSNHCHYCHRRTPMNIDRQQYDLNYYRDHHHHHNYHHHHHYHYNQEGKQEVEEGNEEIARERTEIPEEMEREEVNEQDEQQFQQQQYYHHHHHHQHQQQQQQQQQYRHRQYNNESEPRHGEYQYYGYNHYQQQRRSALPQRQRQRYFRNRSIPPYVNSYNYNYNNNDDNVGGWYIDSNTSTMREKRSGSVFEHDINNMREKRIKHQNNNSNSNSNNNTNNSSSNNNNKNNNSDDNNNTANKK